MKKLLYPFAAILLTSSSACENDPCAAAVAFSLPDLITKSIDVVTAATNNDGTFNAGDAINIGLSINNLIDEYNTCRSTLEASTNEYDVRLYRRAAVGNDFEMVGTATYQCDPIAAGSGLNYGQDVVFLSEGDYYTEGVSNSVQRIEERDYNNNTNSTGVNEAKSTISRTLSIRPKRTNTIQPPAHVQFLPAPNLIKTHIKSTRTNEFITTYYKN